MSKIRLHIYYFIFLIGDSQIGKEWQAFDFLVIDFDVSGMRKTLQPKDKGNVDKEARVKEWLLQSSPPSNNGEIIHREKGFYQSMLKGAPKRLTEPTAGFISKNVPFTNSKDGAITLYHPDFEDWGTCEGCAEGSFHGNGIDSVHFLNILDETKITISKMLEGNCTSWERVLSCYERHDSSHQGRKRSDDQEY